MLASQAALFVYYKVNPILADGFKASVQQMQDQLCHTHPGLTARLWVRSSTTVHEQTWMESYEHPHGLDEGLVAQIEQAASTLPEGRLSPRHLEQFLHV